jgi:hypothetical protein
MKKSIENIAKAVITAEHGWSVADQFESTFSGEENFDSRPSTWRPNALEHVLDALEDTFLNNESVFLQESRELREILSYMDRLKSYLDSI